MNELETVLAERITRLEKTLVTLIAWLADSSTGPVLSVNVAEKLGEILKGDDNAPNPDR